MTTYRYEIEPRPLDLGGGYRLRLLEDGEEVGGGVFPLDEYPEAERVCRKDGVYECPIYCFKPCV